MPTQPLLRVAAISLVAAIVAAGVVLCCFVLAKAYAVLLVLFAAIVLGETTRPLVDRLSKRLSRPLSIVLSVAALALIGAAAIALPLQVLAPQLSSFFGSLPGYLAALATVLQNWLGAGVRTQLAGAIAGNAAPIGLAFIETQKSIVSAVSFVVLVILMAAFWLASSDALGALVLAFFPTSRRSKIQGLFSEMGSALGSYVGGVVINGVLVGLGSTIVLSLLHAPYPIVLGTLQGVLVAVPYLGTLVAVVTAGGIVAASQGLAKGAEVVVLLSLWEGFEGSFISPLVYKKKMNLDPLATILATGIGAAVFGIPGAVLAIPAAALLQTALRYYGRSCVELDGG